jgi:hypothetical protein
MKQTVQYFLFIAAILFATQGYTQSLACNDQINVSVDNTCGIDIGVDAFLEGSDADLMNGMYSYSIMFNNSPIVIGDLNGPVVGGDDMSPYIGMTLEFRVTYINNNNYCWGYILIEDKIPPSIVCDCPVGGNGFGGYDPECILSCYELDILGEGYYAPLINEIITSDAEDLIDASVSDNCNNTNIDIGFSDQIIALPDCQGSLLRRTFAINGSSTGSVCVKEFFVEPLTLDDAITAPFTNSSSGPVPTKIENVLLLPKKTVEIPSCGVSNNPKSIAAFFDNPATEDQDTDDDNISPDQLDVDLVVENNEGIWYAFPHYYIKGRPASGGQIDLHAQAIDNSICSILVGYTDVELEACAPGCGGNNKTVRTWTILDWCTGEYITHEQIIKVVDGDGPVITVNDIHASVDPWDCTANINFPPPEHLFDACDNIISYTVIKGSSSYNQAITGNSTTGFTANNVPVGIHTFRYVAQDCCNNSTTATAKVVVQDYTPPVSISKEFIVTSLTNVSDPFSTDNGVSKIFAVNFDNGSYDGCTDVTLQVRRPNSFCFPEDTVWGDFVKFCCDDLDGQEFVDIDVELRVLDLFGNASKTWSKVRLEDKSGPAIFCPQPMILQCDMDINDFNMTGLPEGINACGEYEFIPNFAEIRNNTEPRDKPIGTLPLYDVDGDDEPDAVPAFNQSCGFGAIRRLFRQDGQTICEQWFVIERGDSFDPASIEFPDDLIVDCDDYDTGEPTFDQAVCNLVGVTLESDTFVYESGAACLQILNHWSIIDWCTYDPSFPNAGGRYDHTQVISLVDREDPVVVSPDGVQFPVGADCLSKGVVLSAVGTDNGECGSEWIGWDIDVDIDGDWILDYHYGSNELPIVNGEPNPFYVPKSTSGEEISIVLPDGIEGSKKDHRIVWRANDGCGNKFSITRFFQITDLKAPTPYCLNLSTAFMQNGQVELWAVDFNIGSFDNCTSDENLIYTFTNVLPPPRCDAEYDRDDFYDGTFWYYDSEVIEDDPTDNDCGIVGSGEYMDEGDYGGQVHRWEPGLRSSGRIFTEADLDDQGFVTVPVYVWDGCTNIDFCNVNLRILDNEGGGVVAGRIVNPDGSPMAGITTQLDAAMPGYPRQEVTDSNGEYAFTNAPFNLDYMLTAISDNDDYLNGVSTLDIVLIQRHILGQSRFEDPMKMISADVNDDRNITAIDLIELRKLILGINDVLPNSDSWRYVSNTTFLSMNNPWQYSTDNAINVMSINMLNQNFTATKIGDVNESASNFESHKDIDSRSYNSAELNIEDQELSEGEIAEVEVKMTAKDIKGLQLAIDLNGLTFNSISSPVLSEENYSLIGHTLTISYADVNRSLQEDWLTLSVTATSSGRLSDMLSINSDRISSEVYVGDRLESRSLQLNFGSKTAESELFQNQPNPFSENTTIGFNLKTEGTAEINLYDVNGRLIKNITAQYDAGYNEVEINKSELETTGLIYYQLKSNDYSSTKHMIVID